MNAPSEIAARLAKATPRPWTINRYDHGGGRAYVATPEQRILVFDAFNAHDREFLANAPTDIEYLLEELIKAKAAAHGFNMLRMDAEAKLADAKAEALEEAGDAPLPAPSRKGETSGFRFWLRARAAELRQS